MTNVELVIDLAFIHRLQSFATQGNPDKQTSEWVTSMSVMYKERVVDDWRFYGASGVITVRICYTYNLLYSHEKGFFCFD